MSDTPFEVVAVKSVERHPNADRLEIVKVFNTQFVSQIGGFHAGDLCVYFPPDMLLPERWAEALGIANYLKHSVFPNDLLQSKCRISAIRLRGVASFGFGISPLVISKALVADWCVSGPSGSPNRDGFDWENAAEGDDVTGYLGGVKYQPPELYSRRGGDSMRQAGAFHTYTNIQHAYNNASAFVVGTMVRITEKIHGTNSRVGLVTDNGPEFMCGTHHRRVKEASNGRLSLYWTPLTQDMKDMLTFISRANDDVIVFGEIYGRKIQKMDYGCTGGYRVFDISVNGKYLDWQDVYTYCGLFGIETVTVLSVRPFTPNLFDDYVDGPTSLVEPDQIKCKFKGREGIVVTPLEEQYSEVLRGRLILKAVSADYYEQV